MKAWIFSIIGFFAAGANALQPSHLQVGSNFCGSVIKIATEINKIDDRKEVELEVAGQRELFLLPLDQSAMQLLTTAFATRAKFCVSHTPALGLLKTSYSIELQR